MNRKRISVSETTPSHKVPQMITPYYNRSDEAAMNKKKMSTHILGVGILMVAVLILTIALIFGLEFPKFVRNRLIDDQCVVDSGHKFYTKWVQESDFIKYTLLYFWNTTNVDEFLEGHQQPQVEEVGPYVFKEISTKEHVDFSGDRVSYSYLKKQIFDSGETRRLCGTQCSEDDTVVVPDMDQMKENQNIQNFNDFVLNRIPEMMKETLHQLSALQTQQRENALKIMNCFDTNCNLSIVSTNITEFNVSDFEKVSFASWIKRNDSEIKVKFLHNKTYSAFTADVMDNFYRILSNKSTFGVTEDHLSARKENCTEYFKNSICHVTGTSNQSGSILHFKNLSHFQTECGLFFLIQNHKNVSSNCILNSSRLIMSFIDTTNLSLQTIDDDRAIGSASLIQEFCLSYLWLTARNESIDWIKDNIFQPKHVAQFNIFTDSFCHGAIPNDVQSNLTLTMYTCLNREHSGRNFELIEVNDGLSTFKTQGHTTFVTSPTYNAPCKHAPVSKEEISMFIHRLRDSVKFNYKSVWNIHGHGTQSYEMNTDDFMRSSGCYRRKNGVANDITDVLYSLPHNYKCPDTDSVLFSFAPDEGQHKSHVSVEPTSGKVWSSKIRLQRNLNFPAIHSLSTVSSYSDASPASFVYPLFWSEENKKISAAEVDTFEERVSNLLGAACGGLIGMSALSIIVVVISALVVIVPRGMNRVAPAPQPSEHMNGTHTPV